MTGRVQLYCGDGKGKTTAAIGQAVRAAGRQKRVLIARFLKTDDSGEVPVLAEIPGITVIPCRKTFGFYFQMTDEVKKEAAEYYTGLLETCKTMVSEEAYDMLVLDEVIAAVNYRLAPPEALIELIKTRPENLELILTGRDPMKEVLGLADYVSEIKMVRHPYETEQLPAREGIEF